ncbi:glycosyltransferase family 2 protein [Streptomyces microflavus]|uniref:glycosyltransferase family 2 protein n=1 Tax=Streptomyces microflavus TaxID=1919 RepID=UPI0036AC9E9B
MNSVLDQVDAVYIIDNGSVPPIDPEQWPMGEGNTFVGSALVDLDPPNISLLWNIGLELAEHSRQFTGRERCDVVVLNSDVIVPSGWVDALSEAMRSTTAILAYPDQFGGQQQILHTKAEPVDLRQRITGYAYMLRGEAGLQLDESMAWWASDDDLDWRAREAGGALLVPGIPVQHLRPNGSMQERPELEAQAGRDMETFRAKWGKTPW